MRNTRCYGASVGLFALALFSMGACGSSANGPSFTTKPDAGDASSKPMADGGGAGKLSNGDAGGPSTFGDGQVAAGAITGTVRDFKFWDGTSNTNPDFEDPPYNIDETGAASPGYVGPWDDHEIVSDTLGSDGKPVYKNPTGTPDANGRVTLTTHGKMWFDMWYNDTPGFNLSVQYPLLLTQTQMGGVVQYGYDSNTQGIPYGFTTGDGFFPIDDGTPYGRPKQTTFGNQSLPNTSNTDPQGDPSASTHNYSFTFELHTTFTYRGGEVFNFRGDDDVFVFINSKLVINLGGVHSPETATVTIDSLGLKMGADYPLDFFSVERHVSGSNILFTTTLALQPAAK
jgi:fibro-slime domain-containing protein